jgi:hypothetical protein
MTPDLPAKDYASEPRAAAIAEAARELVEARDRWLNPPELIERVAEIVPDYPDRITPKSSATAATLRHRTLTKLYNARCTPAGAWLDDLHQKLDEAVAAAYGWPKGISDEAALANLLALNGRRAAARSFSEGGQSIAA